VHQQQLRLLQNGMLHLTKGLPTTSEVATQRINSYTARNDSYKIQLHTKQLSSITAAQSDCSMHGQQLPHVTQPGNPHLQTNELCSLANGR